MRRRTTLSRAVTERAAVERCATRAGQLVAKAERALRDALAARRLRREVAVLRASAAHERACRALEELMALRETARAHERACRKVAEPSEAEHPVGAARAFKVVGAAVSRARTVVERAQPVVAEVIGVDVNR